MGNKFARSNTEKVLGGVCGGIGQYLNIDPIIPRIFFILLTISNGLGFLIYLILWIIMPVEDEYDQSFNMDDLGNRMNRVGKEFSEAVSDSSNRKNSVQFIGVSLIIIGLFVLVDNLNITWLNWLGSDIVWPILLILGGAVLLYKAIRGR
ncbi:MAG: PspC domain-containing protein [Anaerolineaceae bacterium]|nr:PspC domain-containing protein [Anaerolineaceae bacterium]